MAKTFTLSIIFDIVNKATGPLKRVGAQLKKVGKAAAETAKKFARFGKTIALGLTAAVAGIGLLAVKTAADLETMSVAFESMLGSGEAAADMMKKLINFTAKTPFQLEGVGKAAKQLLGFGIAADDMEETLKTLGDIAAGANIPLTDMASIFGKSKAKGKAMTEELMQLSDRGVPIIATLAKGLGVAGDEILELASKGKISFDFIQKALVSMTTKGGIFENQMARQSKTVAGIWSTLKDVINLSLGEIGAFIIKTIDLKKVMGAAISAVERGTKAFKEFAVKNAADIKKSFNEIVRSTVDVSKAIFKWVSENKTEIKGFFVAIKDIAIFLFFMGKAVGTVFNAIGKSIGWALAEIVKDTLAIIEVVNKAIAFAKKAKDFFTPKKGVSSETFAGEDPFAGVQSIASAPDSKTEVQIKVVSDKDSTATVEKVTTVSGNPAVNVATEAYVGAH